MCICASFGDYWHGMISILLLNSWKEQIKLFWNYWGGHWGFAESGNRAILGAEMRESIIVSAEYGQCIYSGPLRIAEITNFCLQICGNRGEMFRKCGIAYSPVTSPHIIYMPSKSCRLEAIIDDQKLQKLLLATINISVQCLPFSG